MRTALWLLVACLLGTAAVGATAATAGSGGHAAAKHTNILCLNKAGTEYVVKYLPRRCAHYGPGGAFAGGVDLSRIRWRSWNRPSVRARARECGFHLPCENVRVRIRAYRRRHACGRIVYTRLKAVSRFGTTVLRLRRCPGSA